MKYDHKTFTTEEASALKNAIGEYSDYDRLDLITEIIFDEKKKKEFLNRTRSNHKNKKEKKVEAMPDAVKYCTGEQCQVDLD